MTDLIDHLTLPESQRDMNWEKVFLQSLPSAKATLISDSPQNGPDHFPYLLAEIKHASDEPIVSLLTWLSEKGIGLVINPEKAYPDYILTYGMIWNFRERGEFITNANPRAETTLMFGSDDKLLMGAPHPQFLPDYVRKILRQFLLDSGVVNPRILVVGRNQEFDLCFSLESLGRPPQKEHEGILKALSWFLPPHYSLALASEKDFKVEFSPL